MPMKINDVYAVYIWNNIFWWRIFGEKSYIEKQTYVTTHLLFKQNHQRTHFDSTYSLGVQTNEQ